MSDDVADLAKRWSKLRRLRACDEGSPVTNQIDTLSDDHREEVHETPVTAAQAEESSRRWADLTDDVELPTGHMGSLSEEERALFRDRVQRRDRRAAEALVKGNLGLVHKIARRYARVATFSDMPYEDVVQEGSLALLRAAETWDPAKGAFSTYASLHVAHAIRRAIQDQGLTVIVPDRFLFTHKAVQGEEHAKAVMSLGRLDAPASDDGETTRGSLLSSGEEGVDDKLDGMRRLHAVRSAISEFADALDERRADVLRRRYLLPDDETLDAIAQTHGVSKARIGQLEQEVIAGLRKFLARRGLDVANLVGAGS